MRNSSRPVPANPAGAGTGFDRSIKMNSVLLTSLERDPLLADRLRRLRTVPSVGPITALTWALEVGDTSRFHNIKQAISYCGL